MTDKVLGDYELLKKIGTGGMGEVFLARKRGIQGFEKLFVIKRIRPELASSPETVRMFLSEARLAAQLSHPNIVQLYDLNQAGDHYFVAMEYINGVDLRQIEYRERQQGQFIHLVHLAKILSYICEALSYAHNKKDEQGRSLNLVHRDVTTSNVLVSFDGGVKLADFGIAKVAHRQLTQAGQIKGKRSYISPEQCVGSPLDQRTDIYTMGVMLYHLSTGHMPFVFTTASDAIKVITSETPPPPSIYRDDLPDELEALILRAMAKDPADRFPDALTMQMALEAFLVKQNAVSNAFLIGQYVTGLFQDVVAAQKRYGPDRQTLTVEGIISGIEESQKSEPEHPPGSIAEVETTQDLLLALQELPTAQKPPGPGSRRKVVMTAAGFGLAGLVVLFVIVLMLRDERTAETARQEPVATPGEVVLENGGRVHDAGSGGEDPETKVDPLPPGPVSGHQTPAPIGRRSGRNIPVASREPGYLTIDSRPWSEVWLRDVKLGMTPLAVRKLPAGRHKLRLVNRKQGLKKTVPIRIRPGKTTKILVRLRKD